MKMKHILAVATAAVVGLYSVGVEAYYYNVNETRREDNLRQRNCLALNVYHEAKGESELGQRAVAYVTLNRAHDPQYPDDVCEVVYQAVTKNGVPVKNKCQFSWYCDGKDDEPTDDEAYNEALYVASVVINTYGMSFDPTMGATMYHADSVKPAWRKSFEQTTQIENHIFYRKE